MRRHTLFSLAVSAALVGVLPAVHASEDAQREARTGTEQDRILWDRNEYRQTDLASNRRDDRDGFRHEHFKRDGVRHADFRYDGQKRREQPRVISFWRNAGCAS
jgi:hypothetical protein